MPPTNRWSLRIILSTGIFVAVLVGQGVDAFSTNLLRHASVVSPKARRFTRQSFSSTSLLSTSTPLDDVSKSASVVSLKKLLERQKEEVEETERLIQRLQDAQEQRTPLTTNGDDEHISTAESILTGFDYGFKSRSEGPTVAELKSASPAFEGYGPPANVWVLGSQQFMRNLRAMVGEYRDEEDVELSPKQREYQEALERLTLSSDAIWERETADGPIEAPWVIKIPYLVLCYMLDRVFEGRYVPHRFFLLETVARMPYFSYIGYVDRE